jgi:hypothetical protein
MPLQNWIWLRSKPLCALAVLLALGVVDLQSSAVAALNAANLSRECLKLFKSWQKKGGYGAFAAAPNGSCGWGSDFVELKGARGAALSACRKTNVKRCTIVAENQRPPKSHGPFIPNLKGTSAAISLKSFQTKLKLSTAEMKLRFGAVGKVVCPTASGTVFLVERPDVFVTSDHIFVDTDKKGQLRRGNSKCWVQFFFSKERYSIKTEALVHGLKTNKTAYRFVWYDWAIGQLDRPVADVQPFAISPIAPGVGLTISVVSEGMNDRVPRVCTGQVTSAWGNYSVNDITTTCTSGPGASGGPIFIGSVEQSPEFPLQAIALTRGYRFVDAESQNHQALPLTDGEMQKALGQTLRKLDGQPLID